jgi:hypothetical protein
MANRPKDVSYDPFIPSKPSAGGAGEAQGQQVPSSTAALQAVSYSFIPE